MNIITTTEQLSEMVEHYLKQDAFAFDVETVGDNRGIPAVNEVLWISFSTYDRADVIPMGHPNGEFIELVRPLTGQGQKRLDAGLPTRELDYSRDDKKATKVFGPAPKQLYPAQVFKAVKPLLFNENMLTIGHNLIFDLCSVAKYYGGEVPLAPYFDTLVGSFLYDSRNKNSLGLDDCLKRELNYKMEKGIGRAVEDYSFDEVAQYSLLDAKYTFLLWQEVAPKIIKAAVENVMKLEMDVLRVLCDMKLTGAPIDVDHLSDLSSKFEAEIERIRSDIYRIAGRVLNLNSNNEKQSILYGPKKEGGRGLKPLIMTDKGSPSVSSEALEPFRGKDELVDALLEYADINKLLSTYVVPYLGGEVVKTTNGRSKIEVKKSLLINEHIFGDFVQWGAETGRFSSRNPNLQNIPAPEDPDKVPEERQYGRMIRNLFYAPEGHKLVVADYSQIEPRIIASMSKDPIMMANYLEGGDIYTTVGNTMGVNRKAGKVLVLAMAYGVGPDKIAKQIGCTVQEAKDLLNNFSVRFPSINDYRARVISVTRAKGYVATILKRRRYLPEINSRDMKLRAGAERQAFNTRIQGSAADIIKMAMINAHDMIPKEARLILTVHDELVTLTPDHLAEETNNAIREAMESINLLDVPLIADIKTVNRWGEAK